MTLHNVENHRVELFDLNELRRCPNPALAAADETEMREARFTKLSQWRWA